MISDCFDSALSALRCSVTVLAMWQALPSVCFYTVGNSKDQMNSACISPDGKIVAACLNDSTVNLWDVAQVRVARMMTRLIPIIVIVVIIVVVIFVAHLC